MQRCQASGRKVLLSVKADGLEAVAGNADFGDPSVDPYPFGPVYTDTGPVGATYDNVNTDGADADDDLDKRQIDVNININISTQNEQNRPGRPTDFDDRRPNRPENTKRPAPPPRPNETGEPGRPQRLSFSSVPVSTSSSTIRASVSSSRTPVVSDQSPVFETMISVVLPLASEFNFPTVAASEWSASSSATPVVSSDSFETTTSAVVSHIPDSNTHTILFEDFTPSSATLVTDASTQGSTILASVSASTTTTPLSSSPNPTSPTTPDPTPFPNLFDQNHPPTALALTLFSLFGEGHTERADLRPLGPDSGSPATPPLFNGTTWITPPAASLPMPERPLGEEVVVDGFDVQLPVQWRGKYQDTKFRNFVARLRDLHRDAWRQSGGIEGAPGDLGADGKAVVYFGWVGGLMHRRSEGTSKAGWIEWDGRSD